MIRKVYPVFLFFLILLFFCWELLTELPGPWYAVFAKIVYDIRYAKTDNH